jgi:hypothetical protein
LHILNTGEEKTTPADVHYGNNMYGNAAQYIGSNLPFFVLENILRAHFMQEPTVQILLKLLRAAI